MPLTFTCRLKGELKCFMISIELIFYPAATRRSFQRNNFPRDERFSSLFLVIDDIKLNTHCYATQFHPASSWQQYVYCLFAAFRPLQVPYASKISASWAIVWNCALQIKRTDVEANAFTVDFSQILCAQTNETKRTEEKREFLFRSSFVVVFIYYYFFILYS